MSCAALSCCNRIHQGRDGSPHTPALLPTHANLSPHALALFPTHASPVLTHASAVVTDMPSIHQAPASWLGHKRRKVSLHHSVLAGCAVSFALEAPPAFADIIPS